jgi:carbon storage regulator
VLVLTRRLNQSIKIGDDVEIMIIEVRGDQVRLGVTAPRDVAVHRKEVYLQIQQENQNAAKEAASNEAVAAALNGLFNDHAPVAEERSEPVVAGGAPKK